MPKFETPDLTQTEIVGTDALLDQYLQLLAGRKEVDIKDEATLAELARLKTAIALAKSTAQNIDTELSWVGTRAEEGIALTREGKQSKTDEIKLAWETTDPDANVNEMMTHLESYDKSKQQEMNDLRIKINSLFRNILETRRNIVEQILPNCKNEYKQGITDQLTELMEEIILVNQNLTIDSHDLSFNLEQARDYAEQIQILASRLETLYKENIDNLV